MSTKSGQVQLAVNAFFVISGFLIIRSFLSSSLDEYFRKRVLRIYPGYAAALAISAVLAAFTVTNPVHYLAQFLSRGTLTNIATLTYGALDVPGTFAQNPFLGVNGSLWTIQYEFIAYCAVAAYGLFGLFRFRASWLVVQAALLMLYARSVLLHGEADNLLRFSVYFAAGMTAFLQRERIVRSWFIAALALLILLSSLRLSHFLALFTPFAATYLLLFVARVRVPAALAWTRRTDLSYGMYLYAFPIQQSIVYWTPLREPLLVFVIALLLTTLCAMASWRFVERPALAHKHDMSRLLTTR